MKKTLTLTLVVSLVLCLLAVNAYSRRGGDPSDGVVITISPKMIVLDRTGDSDVTVHTNIQLDSVIRASIELNGLTALATFADDRGNLVAKFGESDVKAIVAPPKATLTLTGARIDGSVFAASETIRVK